MRDRCWRRHVKKRQTLRMLKRPNLYTYATRNGDYCHLKMKWMDKIGTSLHIDYIEQRTKHYDTRYKEDFKFKREKWHYNDWYRENI